MAPLLAVYNVRTQETNSIALSDLAENYSTFLEITGQQAVAIDANTAADVKACQQITRLLDTLARHNHIEQDHTHSINEFIRRVLFCLFAEDTQIFAPQQFTNAFALLVDKQGDGAESFFTNLFTVLNTPENERKAIGPLPKELLAFPYVNGGLFSDKVEIPKFDVSTRAQLLDCGSLKWSEISPAIFGAMFQNALDADLRHQLGAHYTSEENILKVIKPLFLDALNAEFERLAVLDESTPKAKAAKKEQLSQFHDKLASLNFLDPACGCGNFLLIAYRELRRLENKVLEQLLDENYLLLEEAIKVNINQFYGIEIEDWPAEIAHLSMWLMQHVMNQETKTSAVIRQQNALTTDWNEVLPASKCAYIMGNPPFAGSVTTSEDQKRWLRDVYPPKHTLGRADFVTGWFVKAASYMKGNPQIQAAFVATNSICQGQQVSILWGLLLSQGIRINFAYTSFKWSNAASKNAGVTCTIVGFAYRDVFDDTGNKRLFHVGADNTIAVQHTKAISPYLLPVNGSFDYSAVIVARSAKPFDEPASFGFMPVDGGNLIISADEHDRIIAAYPESEAFFKRFKGSDEIINGTYRWCLWLKTEDRSQWEQIPPIEQHVDACRGFREQSVKTGAAYNLRETPWKFGHLPFPDPVAALVIPSVSSERRPYIPMDFVDNSTIVSNLCYLLPNATHYQFGILTSRIHMCWMRLTAGKLETRYRYSRDLSYNTFVWPSSTAEQQAKITALAEEILYKRQFYMTKTLAELYNPETMPDDLKQAHADLDLAVERLYRPEPFADDEELTTFMLQLYAAAVRAEQEKEQKQKKPARATATKARKSKAK